MTLTVTGYGCVTPLGAGAAALRQGWSEGKCGIRTIARFDTSALRVHMGGEMPDAGAGPGAPPLRGARAVRAALDEALAASGLPRGTRITALVATTKGFLESGLQIEQEHEAAGVGLPARFVEGELRMRHGMGPVSTLTVSSACASGVAALAVALALAESPATAAVVCVGVDLLSDFVFRGFASLGAMDAAPCRPFDAGRAGLSASEAAAAMVLEPEDRMRARGAAPLGRILGAGLANDATHPTAPDRDGGGLARAILDALREAHVGAESLGHVHAHGTATVFNDAMELRALGSCLGAAAQRIPVTTLKGAIGHTLGAAGLVEVIGSLEAVRAGELPAVTGLVVAEGDLDVLRAPRRLARASFLKTAAGFGGFDAAVVAEGILP